MEALVKKTGSIYVADARIDQRTAIRDAVKELGFTNIKVASSLDEVWDLLEVEDRPPDWIITSVFAAEKTNVYQLLRLCLKEKRFQKCRISLTISPEESGYLNMAFELGLMSWHEKPFTKNSLQVELQSLIQQLDANGGNDCLVASQYLRKHLSAKSSLDALLKFESAMIRLYPDRADLILNMAEALQMKGMHSDALKMLSQARIMDDATAKAAKQLEDMIRMETGDTGSGSNSESASFAEMYKIGPAAVIDHDESTHRLFQEVLGAIGIKEVNTFTDGASACAWMADKGPAIGLVVQEWRTKKISGPALIQRYRDMRIKAPIFIYSSLITAGDIPILREMGITRVIEKPMGKTEILPLIMNTIRQDRDVTSQSALERQIRGAILRKDTEHAKGLIKQLNTLPNVAESTKMLMTAELCYLESDFEGAVNHALKAREKNGDALGILNLIGKAYMKMGQHEEAIKCLRKAQEISPMNVGRLCLLAEASTDSGDMDAASANIDAAKDIDATSTVVRSSEAKVALATGDTGTAREIMAELESVSEIISYMNNRAVFLAKQGQTDEAVKTYIQALSSLPASQGDLAAIVNYNLALVYVRTGNMQRAQSHISAACTKSDSPVITKSKSLKTRIDEAVQRGQVLKITASDAQEIHTRAPRRKDGQITPLDKGQLIAMDLSPGDLCCHQVFSNDSEKDESIARLLAKSRSFNVRKHSTITRKTS